MTGSQDFGDKTLRQIKVISEKAITDITEIARHEIQANVSGARSIYGGLVKPSKKKRLFMPVSLISTRSCRSMKNSMRSFFELKGEARRNITQRTRRAQSQIEITFPYTGY